MRKKTRRKTEIARVVLYARVSTKEQAEKALSIPAQLDAMRRYCQDRGYEIIKEYVEPGASARDGNRKVFKRMLEDVLAPSAQVDALLVYQTSRFMRNRKRAPVLKEMLRRNGVRVIAIMQETSDDPMGNFMEGIFELVDQYESDINGVRTSAALRQNARQGNFNGSVAPFGFKAVRVKQDGQWRNRLVPDPAEVETQREVFRAYVSSRGALRTARGLNQRGYRYRGKFWNKDLVLKVLGESAAIGTYYWGKRDTRAGEWRDRDEWIAVEVEPTVDRALWDLVQELREERDPENSSGRTPSSPLLLAGHVTCGRCGASYQLETSGKRSRSGKYTYRYYNCRSATRVGKEKCSGYRIRTERLDRAVLEAIASHVFSPERAREILRDLVEKCGILRSAMEKRRVRTQRELADVERRLARWYEVFETSDDADDGSKLARIRQLERLRVELKTRLGAIAPLRESPADLYTDESLRRFQRCLHDALLAEHSPLARGYLRTLVQRIEVTGPEIEIIPKP